MTHASGRASTHIPLMRGNSLVSSLGSAFGGGLRETRLTAMLGYLAALEPEKFSALFGFGGRPLSVSLETRHELDRSDIIIETTEGRGVIEAKVNYDDPFEQAGKYHATWLVLLTEHLPTASQRSMPNCRYLRWRDLVPLLQEFSKSSHPKVRFLSEDFTLYLQEHRMISIMPNPSKSMPARSMKKRR